MPKQLPYSIIVDSAEQRPFTFKGLKGDSYYQFKDLIVPTTRRSLGAGKGDYSIDGFEGQIHIERKSREDACSTFLGFQNDKRDRNDRFEDELEFLSSIPVGVVIVECQLDELILNVPSYGWEKLQDESGKEHLKEKELRQIKKERNQKILYRQILSWQSDFKARWLFMWNRQAAESATFRLLDRFYRKNK